MNRKNINRILKKILYSGAIVIFLYFLFFHETLPDFLLKEDSKTPFPALDGKIVIEVCNYKDVCIHNEISENNIVVKHTSDKEKWYKKKDSFNYWFMNNSIKGPELDEYVYYGPYQFNKPKSLGVLSIANKKSDTSPRGFVVVDWPKMEVIYLNKQNEFHIDSISISPDSKKFAVIRSKSQGVISISSCAGHPTSKDKYFLSIFDIKGQLLSEDIVAQNIIGGGAVVQWE